MASIDSGVDTENESSDSNIALENSKMNDDSRESSVPDISPQPLPPLKKQEFIFPPVDKIHTVFEPMWPAKAKIWLEPSSGFDSPIYPKPHFHFYNYMHDEYQNKISLRHVWKRKHQIIRFHSKNHEIAHIKKILAEKRLRMAASLNHVETVKRLLGAGVNPQSTDEKHRTALHIAACKGYGEIVELLLAGGADPNQKDIVGNTALHVAAYTNHFRVILQLLRATVANLNKVDESGCKLLKIAQGRMQNVLKDLNSITSERNVLQTEIEESLKFLDVILKHCSEKAEADLISGFSNRLSLKQSKEEGENTIQDVLSSLSELTLQKSI